MTVDLQPGSHQERNRRPRTQPPLLSPKNTNLIQRLAQTLQALEEAGDPRRSTPIEGQTRTKRPNSEKDEGEPTRWARSMERRIVTQISNLLNEFDGRVDGNWKPHRREKVRCIKKTCSNYGKRIPRHVGPGVELVHCSSCGNRLTGVT